MTNMPALCEGYLSPYPERLKQFEQAAFSADQEYLNHLVNEVIHGQHPDCR